MNNKSSAKLFVISAPSAGGKTTIITQLISLLEGTLKKVVTYTTRDKRSEETNGIDYNFVSEKEFLEKVEQNAFIEHSVVYGNYYGVLEKDLLSPGNKVISLDSNGVYNLKKLKIPAIYILIKPPSLEVLKQRLLKRGSETNDQVKVRLAEAKKEIEQEHIFDHVVINDKLEDAIKQCKNIIIGENKNEKTY